MRPRLGLHEQNDWYFFFILCDWTSNLKLLLQRSCCPVLGIWAQGLAHMSWTFKIHSIIIWLNFKPQAVFWRLRCRELQILVQGLGHMSWNIDVVFHSMWLKFKPQAALMKVSLPRAWNMSSRLGSHELKIWFTFSFFVIELQTSS